MEQTVVFILPNAIRNRHVGEVISEYDSCGLRVMAVKTSRLSRQLINKINPLLANKLTTGVVITLLLQGENAISMARQRAGSWERNTLNGRFGHIVEPLRTKSEVERGLELLFTLKERVPHDPVTS